MLWWSWFLIQFLLILSGLTVKIRCDETVNGVSRKDNNIHVVIARFEENIDHLSWLQRIPHTIFNRGDDVIGPLHVVERLENVGRESFLYLSYIAHNYHRLANVTVFSQASQAVKTIYNDGDFRKDVEDLALGRVFLPAHTDGFAFCIPTYTSVFNAQHLADLTARYGEERAKIFHEGYQTLLHFTVDNPRFSGTGCFFVTRDVILRNSRSYYVKLARLLGRENNPVEGHFFERAWPEVFHSNCSSGKDFRCLVGAGFAT